MRAHLQPHGPACTSFLAYVRPVVRLARGTALGSELTASWTTFLWQVHYKSLATAPQMCL